jgi:S-adenosylmethionine uptake transporter
VIVLRSIGTSEKIETLVLYTLGAVGIVNLVLLPRWIQPTETQCLMLLVIGMLFYAGNLVITRAIQLAPASLIAPLRYTTFIWASGFGWYFFAKLPDMWTIAGIVLIAMSGILLARKPA